MPGVASTQIAFVSTRTGHKEIWVMDYDGANQRQLTHLGSISLTPRWSPDAARIAFTCYSHGSQIIFSSSMAGNPELYEIDSNGGRPKRLTYSNGASTSPAWNPKTGQT